MKIKHQLTALILSFSLIIIFMFAATFFITKSQKYDGLVINLAGRQRMLSQKMTKETLAYTINQSQKAAESLKNTAKVFDMTLKALKDSGKAPMTLNLETTVFRECPLPEETVVNQLGKVSSIWEKFTIHIDNVLEGNSQADASIKWIENNNLKLLSEMNKAVGMMQSLSENKVSNLIRIQIFSILVGLIIMIISMKIVFTTIKRMAKVESFAKGLGSGDLNVKSGLEKNDELGKIGKDLDHMAGNIKAMITDITTNAQKLSSSSGSLSSISSEMSEGVNEVTQKSNTVAAAAEQMSSNMNSVAAAVEETSTNVEIVAKSAEQMMITIQGIATNTDEARSISAEAVTQAHKSSDKINKLGSAANEIGKVTEAINEISEQTNLLALNATIEAARAGEAGKGFAVVANEIKELAKQTADATNDIKDKVDLIQDATGETVTEIGQISEVVNNVNKIVAEIASSVKEQSVTTEEIADNVGQASLGIQEVNENVAQTSIAAGEVARDISGVNSETTEIQRNGGEVMNHSDELLQLAEELSSSVGRFRI